MLAEIARAAKEGDGLAHVRGFVLRVRETSKRLGHPELGEDALRALFERLSDILPAGTPLGAPSAPTFLTCEACKFTWSEPSMADCITVPGAQNASPGGPFPCPMCARRRAEAQLLSGPGDAWWAEVGIKAQKMIESGQALPDGGFPLGFFQEDCAPGVMIGAISRPQIEFRPLYIVVDPRTDDGILVDFKVGNRSQDVNAMPLPLSAFNPERWGSLEAMLTAQCFQCDTARIAQDISLTVEMRTRGPFRAVIWGDRKTPEKAEDLPPPARSAYAPLPSLVERIRGQ